MSLLCQCRICQICSLYTSMHEIVSIIPSKQYCQIWPRLATKIQIFQQNLLPDIVAYKCTLVPRPAGAARCAHCMNASCSAPWPSRTQPHPVRHCCLICHIMTESVTGAWAQSQPNGFISQTRQQFPPNASNITRPFQMGAPSAANNINTSASSPQRHWPAAQLAKGCCSSRCWQRSNMQ